MKLKVAESLTRVRTTCNNPWRDIATGFVFGRLANLNKSGQYVDNNDQH